ncbi:MAG: efflux RND transporter periplasmic adaptor subunit [Phycisphaerales bacterium]|nr:efflux RND transporter periplasmic adaptor subunit [Phycisphaerales bacterium]
MTNFAEFTGTTESIEFVEIRARVKGFLEKVNFEPGADVNEGDLLFVIDSKPFQAQLDKAEANLASRNAELSLAEYDFKRVERLHEENNAAEYELIQARSGWGKAKAAVQAAKAAVDESQLNLGYTRIQAPISGRLSRSFVDAGNLVGAGEYTLLTTIVKDDPIYAYFNASEQKLLEFLESHPEKRSRIAPQQREPLHLGLANETGYPHEGQVDWADNRVDANTGTIRIRGVFPNPDHVLLPGLFARIRAPKSIQENALLIADRALGADQGGRFVLVVDEQNVVDKRYVEIGSVENGMRIIVKGLAPDERVIVKGVQRARDGAKVNPTLLNPQPSPSPIAEKNQSEIESPE